MTTEVKNTTDTVAKNTLQPEKVTIHILCVDDEPDSLELLRLSLNKDNFALLFAQSATEALNILEKNNINHAQRIDVVILDMSMPDISGKDTLPLIQEKHPNVAVILLSGHADVQLGIELIRQGAFDYMIKPADADELIYKIEDAAKQKKLDHKLTVTTNTK